MSDIALGNLVWKVTGDTSALNRNVEKSKKKISSFKKLAIKAGVAIGGAFAVAGLIKFGAGLAKLAINAEQTRVSFITFLKDVQLADKTLGQLKEFSVVTPFTISQVNKAGKSLLAFGTSAKELVPTLSKIGDIAAGTGKDFNELVTIYGKARIAGTLYAEDINQLVEAGVPIISEFAKQLGISESEVKKFASEGKLKFSELETAFNSLTTEGGLFFNLMEDQSKTLGGRLSTLQGNFSLLGKAIGDKLTPAIGTAVNFLNKFIVSQLESENAFADQRDELTKNKAVLDARFNILKRGEITEKERSRLIKRINVDLKELNQTLITEKTTIEGIAKAQKAANVEFLRRIKIAAVQAVIQDKVNEATKLQKKNISDLELLESNRLKVELTSTGRNRKALINAIPVIERRIRLREAAIEKLSEEIANVEKLTGVTIEDTEALDENTGSIDKNTGAIDKNVEVVKTKLEILEEKAAKAEASINAVAAVFNALNDVISGGVGRDIEGIDAQLEKDLEALDARTEAQLAKSGILEEDEITKLQAKKDRQLAFGNDIAAAETQKEIDNIKVLKAADEERAKIEKDAAKRKAALEFKATTAAWANNLALAVATAPITVLNAYTSGYRLGGPITAGIFASLAGAAAALQVGAVAASKPKKPSFNVGTMEVPKDMEANIHKGEIIVPATMSEAIRQGEATLTGGKSTAGGKPIIIQLVAETGEKLKEWIFDGTRDRTIKIDEGALVATGI